MLIRLRSLDGLRGLAALIVVIHHSLLVVPGLAAPYFGQSTQSSIQELLTYSPLHLLWAGTEAVFLFFVLSGIVLTRMAAARDFSWASYFSSRILRLYAPTFAAVVLGFVIISLTAHNPAPESNWLQNRGGDYSATALLLDLSLISSTSGRISPLWTLQWEIIFSLALPLMLQLKKGRPVLVCFALFAALGIGVANHSAAFTYIPMFGLGIVLAANWDVIGLNFSRRKSSAMWHICLTILFAGSLLLIDSRWLLAGRISGSWADAIIVCLELSGIMLLIPLVAFWGPPRWLFSTKVFLWLGTVSFSLYLVHEPIILGVAFITGGTKTGIILSFILSFVFAQIFYMLIERPIHRWSRRLRASASVEAKHGSTSENSLATSTKTEAESQR
jgi:peptidoglycan/LPS O-acetylase OafA/YrhL